MKEFISKKILVYNSETGKYEPIDAIRGESAYEIAVRTGQTTLPEDEWIKQIQSGQIDSDFVKTVNSLHPDENGDVKVTVNGQTADENGNIQIDVGGKVQSVNGQSPDPETGNVEIEVGNPDVITTLTRDEFNALTTAQIQKMYEDGVRTILVENEMEEGEGIYTISWDGITDKPTEYPPTEHRHEYAENLLKNAEFELASMGYGGIQNSIRYAADMWGMSNATAIFRRSSEICQFTAVDGYSYIYQKLDLKGSQKGKDYTAVISLSDGTIKIANATFPETDVENETVAGSVVVKSNCMLQVIIGVDGIVRFRIDLVAAEATVDFKYCLFYEGSYTVDNLPPFVPTHPRVENLKLGSPVQPTQLLVNPDFAIAQAGYPVWDATNQKWTSGLHGTSLYVADRWEAYDDIDFTKLSNGISIKERENSTRSFSAIWQYFYIDTNKTNGKRLTFASKINGNIYTVGVAITNGSQQQAATNLGNGNSIALTVTANGKRSFCQINVIKNTALAIEWAVLYEGAYTTETLPPFVPPDATLELAKCQSVYLPINYDPLGNGYTTGGGGKAYIFIPTPVPMNTDAKSIPSIIYDTSDFYVRCNGTDYLASAVGVLAKRGENFIIVELVNSELPPRQVVAAYKLTPGVALSTEP